MAVTRSSRFKRVNVQASRSAACVHGRLRDQLYYGGDSSYGSQSRADGPPNGRDLLVAYLLREFLSLLAELGPDGLYIGPDGLCACIAALDLDLEGLNQGFDGLNVYAPSDVA